MTWLYGFGGGSSSYFPSPSAYVPPPLPVYYAPPAYDFYTPPSYEYTTPSYEYTPPSYEYTTPSYGYTSYSDPVRSYTPDPYDFGTPAWSPNSFGGVDLTRPSYNEFLYTTDPMAYDTGQIKNYVEDIYGVPYGQYEQDYYGGASGFGLDPYNVDVGSDTNYGGSYADMYGDLSGSSYNIPDAIPDSSSYDFGSNVDYGSRYNIPEINYSGPGSDEFSNAPESASTRSLQVANLDPRFSGVVSDTYQGPDYFAQATTSPVSAPNIISTESGAPKAGASILPLADGSAVVTRTDGSTVTLNPDQAARLLSGDNSVLTAQATEKTTENLGPNTVVSKNSLSLEPTRPAYNPETMEGTRAQYEARNAAEMARANAAGVISEEELLARQKAYGNQQLDVSPGNLNSYNKTIQDIMQNRGGFTSQWQTAGNERYMINDDGTGIGINENGEPFAISAYDVNRMIDNKILNTKGSGYVAATGGTGDRPGGSPAERSALQKLLDNIRKKLPELKFEGKGGGGGGGGGGVDKKDGKTGGMDLALMGLLAALAARSDKSGGAGITMPTYGLDRAKAELDKGRRAGSTAQSYYTGPGVVKKAAGGITSLSASPLGGYSDGGRLLRGPGDGVSDSIPATIGKKQPARLADGEFVVPARIVSELGNGSTEAGARKLYAMMERVQKARGKTVGKGKVAHNSRADKYLPK